MSDDPFFYDGNGLPVSVHLRIDTWVFGYDFCATLKSLLAYGCQATSRLYKTDNRASIFIFDPKSKEVEIWQGQWRQDEPDKYFIVNPEQIGLLDQQFESFDAVITFSKQDSFGWIMKRGQIIADKS